MLKAAACRFNGIAEMSIAIERLPIFAKQRDNFFYRPMTYVRPQDAADACAADGSLTSSCLQVLPVTIMRLPYSVLEAVVWTNLTCAPLRWH